MSFLSLRLPTAKRAWWKSLTSKIQSKLHKLHKPKAITKRRNHRVPYKSKITKRSFLVETRKRLVHTLKPSSPAFRVLKCTTSSSTAPVYVDKLFKEPISTKVDEPLHTIPPPKKLGKVDQQASPAEPGTSKEAGNGVAAAADDMWESMGFASPQMHGIDERAEEFIAKFRAEMEVQERLARDHL
ncbi:hypothetical protein PanWU01x14_137420 [Parasponia andersonii]|uniref:Cotton fiber protein n=1 Tax=Parasponia andersonii TaxID=3476 RepID=A0A2P5CNL1_PARAD|nr:hypothetical protein PanWU01x14_137420 [Parasponia andersonii]